MRAMRGGSTLVTYPNVGPDAKVADSGALEFNTLNRSHSSERRRLPPSGSSLLARRLRMLVAARRRVPNGSRRSVTLFSCAIAVPPSGSTCRKVLVRCPVMPLLLCRKPDTEMSYGIRYVPVTVPAQFHVSSHGKNSSLGLLTVWLINRWFFTTKYDA